MPRNTPRQRQRGIVLLTMALVAVGVFATVGLAVDIGRMFIAKNETQTYCDSAALAAAIALDGTSGGITRAQSALTSSANTWEFGTATLTDHSIAFATAATGPWVANPDSGTGYMYARVTATAPLPLYFLPLVVEQKTFNVVSSATAGQIAITSLSRGVAPFTAVSTNTNGPNFGMVPGNSYDLQWPQYNGTRGKCSLTDPASCFNSSPCSGETTASMTAVVSNWGSSLSGYWGSQSASAIAAEVLDSVQLQPVEVGANIYPLLTSGNKATEAKYLDERASQDADTSDSTVDAYLANPAHNGRRLLAVAIVDPVDPSHTNVVGYGQFLLMANGSPSNYYVKTTNGNDPYCAVYAGPYNIGSTNPAAGGATGATTVRLVQ
ncbi:MAG TPA: pilus assembly protein TadG-related protein [Bryobacteraceae bacterium]|nr:pilus assembly protein TadG-related protein [Bryobacteraceae bacterium]